jgi:hypothetical protein
MKPARKELVKEALKLLRDDAVVLERHAFVAELMDKTTHEDGAVWCEEIFWDLFHQGIITPKTPYVNLPSAFFVLHSEHSANQARLEQALLQ